MESGSSATSRGEPFKIALATSTLFFSPPLSFGGRWFSLSERPDRPEPLSLYKYPLPAGKFYNFVMAFSFILPGIGALLSYLGKVTMGRQERNSVTMDAVVGVLVVFLFPMIYNNVATVVNFLSHFDLRRLNVASDNSQRAHLQSQTQQGT